MDVDETLYKLYMSYGYYLILAEYHLTDGNVNVTAKMMEDFQRDGFIIIRYSIASLRESIRCQEKQFCQNF